jgi:hypothetical protein
MDGSSLSSGLCINHITFLYWISTSLVEQYIELSRTLHFVAHRKKELKSLFKKMEQSTPLKDHVKPGQIVWNVVSLHLYL